MIIFVIPCPNCLSSSFWPSFAITCISWSLIFYYCLACPYLATCSTHHICLTAFNTPHMKTTTQSSCWHNLIKGLSLDFFVTDCVARNMKIILDDAESHVTLHIVWGQCSVTEVCMHLASPYPSPFF
jgi:hypothetical protein